MSLSLVPVPAVAQTQPWWSYLPGASSSPPGLPGLPGTTPATTGAPAGSSAAILLPAYNVAPGTVTVAGISSGGFMAVQLQVAYSQSIYGTAVFAGGPFYCAQGSMVSALGYCEKGSGIPLQTLVDYTNAQEASGKIDPTSHLANKPIYMFSGTADTTVKQGVMDTLEQYYARYTDPIHIVYNKNTPAAHGWISPYGTVACGSSSTPYINNCGGMDAEQTFLTNFYGSLNAKNTGKLTGSYVKFDQNEFASGNAKGYSMDSAGWLFVPQNCASNQPCRLVIALHGCLQHQGAVQQQFVQKSGINEWADTNNIIVLYPQTTPTQSTNPLGCWDWWGYRSADYALKTGPQMTAIMTMVAQITSGYKPAK